jgi:hypothetical protein
VTDHIKPSERTRFARSSREAFGSYYPITRRASWGDRFVAAVCIVGLVVLLAPGVL